MPKRTSHSFKTIAVPAGNNGDYSTLLRDFVGNFLTMYSVTGTIEMRLGENEDWIPAAQNFTYRAEAGEKWNRIHLRSKAGGSISFFYGWGMITAGGTAGGGGGGSVQIVTGAGADPNAALVVPEDPASPAIYYQIGVANPTIWVWDTTANTWR